MTGERGKKTLLYVTAIGGVIAALLLLAQQVITGRRARLKREGKLRATFTVTLEKYRLLTVERSAETSLDSWTANAITAMTEMEPCSEPSHWSADILTVASREENVTCPDYWSGNVLTVLVEAGAETIVNVADIRSKQ